jgi:hypothetical protein
MNDIFILEEEHYYKTVFPIFNRSGIYYDRVYDFAWFELGHGKAFEYDKRMFFYELNQLCVWQKYNHRQYEALQHAMREKIATRQQREDWRAYRYELETRSTYLDARRNAFKWVQSIE